MRLATLSGIALLTVLSLPLAAAPAAAVTQMTVGPISAILPDMDGIFDGDSDPYIEVRVDGVLIGVTSIINGNNNPSWPTTFTTVLTPVSSPFLVVELKAYDFDNLSTEYLGMVQIAYNWVAGNPVTFTAALSLPNPGPPFSITTGLDANDIVVPVRANTWGAIKALYR